MEDHGCCGCSCHVCENGHNNGAPAETHTDDCWDRFWAGFVKNNPEYGVES